MDFIRTIINWFVLGMLLWIVLSYIVTFGRLGWDHPVRKVYDALSKITLANLAAPEVPGSIVPLSALRVDLESAGLE